MSARPLEGIRVVEVSSFVASPLCGLTLAQLGAEVIRIDPVGGAADVHRWPLTSDGHSIYWTGLNKGKKSVTVDLRSPEGQTSVQDLVTGSGPGGGILVTNAGGRQWMSHDTLAALRPDVITLELLGRSDGSPGVDYTVNAGIGFPSITGPLDAAGEPAGVVNHVLPAWDVVCGIYAALAITAAVRRREQTGTGARITLPLEDTALAIAGALGYLTEPQVNGAVRPATGNDVYGTYGTDFETADGGRFMIVALTPRHFRDLVRLTGTTDAVDAVEKSLGADFSTDTDRFNHRAVLTPLFAAWFARHTTADVEEALASSSVLSQRYRDFAEVAGTDLTGNPLFAPLVQPGLGEYLAAGLPAVFDGEHYHTGPAPALGADNGTAFG
ncbi:2-methylfumaryl-CoA isomerase [Gordonia pseudamarae]|jgi:2-methylfumaryl-CoA isomerase|uniref:2-methylfumaryl-CoA isomerase n=1 Tax=Gordonia pseudamarae TaxID=2831662 RepID=A0ABX6IK49_9ACTN|nr:MULTISPECIES: CoA transferase [Gordonia]MBD0023176.1 CoA transferase [Gordonia sp. (in: high G+C Gram-positive bacteria)]QHN27112.1 2-methylfumaryl-CoA isomerase [Gordonia pseudamarae]QHN36001.1 2-methylfumaryl-CoA isomerase [Gordonia pseudamarae]